jgi:hypothetical protein
MYISQIISRLGASLVCAAGIANAAYAIQDTYDYTNFFAEFSFFSGADPTSGFVTYSAGTAANATLAGYSDNAVYLGVDSTTTLNPAPGQPGRPSVRLSSNKAYTHGLFIADIAHMPGGICGVWPAFWTFGPNWPTSGEIDIIEGVNLAATDSITLHTSSGCSMTNSGSASGSVLQNANCNTGDDGTTGCGFNTSDTRSFGAGFNANGGGVYAMEWTSSAIEIYFWPRSAIPADITSGNPDPTTWGTPTASFSGSGTPGCNIDQHFINHNIIFDTTFCGAWAGTVWAQSQCASLAPTCAEYVAQNPKAFAQAYWLINSVKVYQATSTAGKRDAVVATPFLA